MASKPREDIGAEMRHAVRDLLSDGRMIERCTKDIRRLLLGTEESEAENFAVNTLSLWDNKLGEIKSGVSYALVDNEPDEPGEGYGKLFTEIKEET